jgi:hypothetical protein
MAPVTASPSPTAALSLLLLHKEILLNPTVILALISDLYTQVNTLSQENEKLRAKLAEPQDAE